MKLAADAEFVKRIIHGEKIIPEEAMLDPFLLGLSIVSFTSDFRDKVMSELKKSGYEVEDLR